MGKKRKKRRSVKNVKKKNENEKRKKKKKENEKKSLKKRNEDGKKKKKRNERKKRNVNAKMIGMTKTTMKMKKNHQQRLRNQKKSPSLQKSLKLLKQCIWILGAHLNQVKMRILTKMMTKKLIKTPKRKILAKARKVAARRK